MVVPNIYTSPNRNDYAMKKAKAFYNANMKNPNGYKKEVQTIRKVVEVKDGKLGVSVDLRKGDGFNSPLATGDAMVIYGMRMGFIKVPKKEGSTTEFEAIENQSIVYYPSQTIFNHTKTGAVPQYKAFNALYNGYGKFVISGGNVALKMDLSRFKKTPISFTEGVPYYGPYGPTVQLEEMYVVLADETASFETTVQYADTITSSGSDDEQIYLVFEFEGLVCINCKDEILELTEISRVI